MQNLARSLALAAPRKRMRPGSGFPRVNVDDRANVPAGIDGNRHPQRHPPTDRAGATHPSSW
jgi:hypothetical protein